MGIDVLNGADAATMAVKTISDTEIVINTEVLDTFKLEIPQSFADAKTVVTEK